MVSVVSAALVAYLCSERSGLWFDGFRNLGARIVNGRSGLWRLWCLRILPLAPSVLGRSMVSMVSDGLNLGGRGYGAYGV